MKVIKYECQDEETENLESNESEKLLDKKLEEEQHTEDEENEGKRKNEEADSTRNKDSKKRKRRKLKDKVCLFN